MHRVFGIKDFNFSKEDLETLDKEDIKEQLEEKVKIFLRDGGRV